MAEQSEGKINSDCNVCRKMLKAKYQAPKWLYALVLVLLMSTTVLGVLYFGEGNIGGTTEIEINNELDNGSTANTVTGNNSTISGNVQVKDNSSLYIMIALIIGSIIIAGSIVYVNKNRAQDKNNDK